MAVAEHATGVMLVTKKKGISAMYEGPGNEMHPEGVALRLREKYFCPGMTRVQGRLITQGGSQIVDVNPRGGGVGESLWH